MGVVISFNDYAKQRMAAPEAAQRTAQAPVLPPVPRRNGETVPRADAGDVCASRDVLVAVKPLLRHCRDQFGFTVMRGSMPSDPGVLAACVLALTQALKLLEAEMGPCRSKSNYGVYFGRDELSWFEDGYGGTTGLAVPHDIDAKRLADFVRPHVFAMTR
jgi:hypothetical protein